MHILKIPRVPMGLEKVYISLKSNQIDVCHFRLAELLHEKGVKDSMDDLLRLLPKCKAIKLAELTC